jgi:hypothetical protein
LLLWKRFLGIEGWFNSKLIFIGFWSHETYEEVEEGVVDYLFYLVSVISVDCYPMFVYMFMSSCSWASQKTIFVISSVSFRFSFVFLS